MHNIKGVLATLGKDIVDNEYWVEGGYSYCDTCNIQTYKSDMWVHNATGMAECEDCFNPKLTCDTCDIYTHAVLLVKDYAGAGLHRCLACVADTNGVDAEMFQRYLENRKV